MEPGDKAPSWAWRMQTEAPELQRWTIILIHPPECLGAEGRLAHKLFRDLFANYTSALRPVADTDQTLNVTLEVTLSQIIDMV